jgi:hypothetical protein
VVKDIHLFPKDEGGKLEGGALVHDNGLYYVIGSQMTGWRPNPNKYASAPTLEGLWSNFEDIAPPPANTYGSQSSMLLKVIGTKATTIIFIGDIWKPKDLSDSRYLWMSLQIDGNKLFLPSPKPWTINVTTGERVVK